MELKGLLLIEINPEGERLGVLWGKTAITPPTQKLYVKMPSGSDSEHHRHGVPFGLVATPSRIRDQETTFWELACQLPGWQTEREDMMILDASLNSATAILRMSSLACLALAEMMGKPKEHVRTTNPDPDILDYPIWGPIKVPDQSFRQRQVLVTMPYGVELPKYVEQIIRHRDYAFQQFMQSQQDAARVEFAQLADWTTPE